MKPRQDNCGKCGGREDNFMVACEKCNSWFHYECVDLTFNLVERIETYYCERCENKSRSKLLTVWKGVEANEEQIIDKEENYFEVEKILEHRYKTIGNRRRRQFKIKWKGYSNSENSWEPEENLDGALDLLQKYLRSKDLPLSNIEKLLGSTKSSKVEKRNWQNIKDIISLFLLFKLHKFPDVCIATEAWENFKNNDSIFFLDHGSHCYVLLYYADRGFAFIADGGNSFSSSSKISKEIRQILNIKLISRRYNQQTRVDHCASSAILIALEFVRAYKNKIVPKVLSSPKRWRAQVIKRMHLFDSHSLSLPPLHLRKQLLKCEFCDKGFKSNDRSRYYHHMLMCNKRI